MTKSAYLEWLCIFGLVRLDVFIVDYGIRGTSESVYNKEDCWCYTAEQKVIGIKRLKSQIQRWKFSCSSKFIATWYDSFYLLDSI